MAFVTFALLAPTETFALVTFFAGAFLAEEAEFLRERPAADALDFTGESEKSRTSSPFFLDGAVDPELAELGSILFNLICFGTETGVEPLTFFFALVVFVLGVDLRGFFAELDLPRGAGLSDAASESPPSVSGEKNSSKTSIFRFLFLVEEAFLDEVFDCFVGFAFTFAETADDRFFVRPFGAGDSALEIGDTSPKSLAKSPPPSLSDENGKAEADGECSKVSSFFCS